MSSFFTIKAFLKLMFLKAFNVKFINKSTRMGSWWKLVMHFMTSSSHDFIFPPKFSFGMRIQTHNRHFMFFVWTLKTVGIDVLKKYVLTFKRKMITHGGFHSFICQTGSFPQSASVSLIRPLFFPLVIFFFLSLQRSQFFFSFSILHIKNRELARNHREVIVTKKYWEINLWRGNDDNGTLTGEAMTIKKESQLSTAKLTEPQMDIISSVLSTTWLH